MAERRALYLVRGLPGSGKSTLAAKLAPDANFAADMFFEKSGEYVFDPKGLGDAHTWCQERTANAMNSGVESVAVHNTFTQNWEMEFYKESARECGYEVFVIVCENTFANTHNCPPESIDRMRQRWEPNFRRCKETL